MLAGLIVAQVPRRTASVELYGHAQAAFLSQLRLSGLEVVKVFDF